MVSKEERRINIIEAAVKVFSKKGFHKARMEDIAKEAGIGKGTIYEYFDSKKHLFYEMIKHNVNLYKDNIKVILEKESNLEERLLGICRYHGRFISEHIDMAQSIISQSHLIDDEMKCWLFNERMNIFTIFLDIFKDSQKKGELRKDLNIEAAVLSLIGTINQYYSKKIFAEGLSYEEIDPIPVLDVLLKGIE
ncbi:TetR/AcrR family transcriptional regulator [Thermohalobacter berrensis]|uniref:HTH tetR-type domain-containing protein n=1 Tax=Thermohalobacter berrensis TaxID=99594 RepID=A0A419T7R5_9FIRM|nr:TetR/AcrR family transcriptional regulator [Thermohalobacter berrensis]RKD33521.1 hypothetical protein BET03_09035 [Thermohalobacter berrensis]